LPKESKIYFREKAASSTNGVRKTVYPDIKDLSLILYKK
jgi:hypothetical protein